MVDVEFITQYLQLLHAAQVEALRQQNTIHLLETMVNCSILPEEDGSVLIGGYKFLRRIENKLRLLYDQSINELSAHNKGFRKAALSLGYGKCGGAPEREFLDEYHQVTEHIRALLEKYLNPDASGCE
jgi:glutamate-ammonia-ligase adenylyltransferase